MLRQWRYRWGAIGLLACVAAGAAAAGELQAKAPKGYTLSAQFAGERLPFNRIHHWDLLLRGPDGKPLSGRLLRVSGGMPAHQHGLPSVPQVHAHGAAYRLEGLLFHMAGEWQLALAWDEGGHPQVATFHFTLAP